MAQHFLLSAKARTFSLIEIANMTEYKAQTFFRKLRWADTHGHPVCPVCGSTRHYDLATRNVYKCKACSRQFSVTSGTLFSGHKLPMKTILMALAIFSNAAKGISALQLTRDLNVQYKTAFVLLHKFREALLETRDESPMDGVCEMDGCFVAGYVRPANNVTERIDLRLAANQSQNKRCILTLRQLSDEPHQGAIRTLPFVARGESQIPVSIIANRHIARGTTIHTDESSAYDPLHARFSMMRINHSRTGYSSKGACSNQAESYFSRLRRMEIGVIHRLNGKYILDYANEIAYREDTRKKPNGYILRDVAIRCMKTVQSNELTGYWQGNHRMSERLVA